MKDIMSMIGLGESSHWFLASGQLVHAKGVQGFPRICKHVLEHR